MNFESHSQAGQDQFVYEVLVKPEKLFNGTFLDIGSGHPIETNNTYALEQIGWRGLLCDRNIDAAGLTYDLRPNTPIWNEDATEVDWMDGFKNRRIGPRIDYLSLDVNEYSLEALGSLPLNLVRFRVITIEHDAYANGDSLRQPMRKILERYGYDLVCADVKCEDRIFEDWWIDPLSVDPRRVDRFRSVGKDWKEILYDNPPTH